MDVPPNESFSFVFFFFWVGVKAREKTDDFKMGAREKVIYTYQKKKKVVYNNSFKIWFYIASA
jgi:hypothetical protein